MRRVAIKRDDGGVSIMFMVNGVDIEKSIAKWESTSGSKCQSFRELGDGDSLPGDREFRAAWEDDGAAIRVNMAKARDIKMEQIRAARNAKLEQLDVELMRAEDNDDRQKIARLRSQRQSLRDVPQKIDLETIDSPEQLKAFTPDELKAV